MQDQFTLAASKAIMQQIDAAADKAGVGRGQAFEDFLTCTRCALAGETMEVEYLATVHKGYHHGKQGERGIDRITKAFALTVSAMETTGDDVLSDLFTGGITYGEKGQFFTPSSVCDLMAQLNVPNERTDAPKTVCDPASGSGRMLLHVGKYQPHWEFTGQDSDHRCAQMTAINLGLNGLRGWAVWMNTLTLECHRVYKIGLHVRGPRPGVIREIPVEQTTFRYHPLEKKPTATSLAVETVDALHLDNDSRGQQLNLF
ncbi:MAG: N-6 DNA methylase [Pirellulaceae bacterium]